MEFHGGPAQHPLPPLSRNALNWRAMTAGDLDAVASIAAVGFPDHFEGRDCFENRLALNPEGCFVLAGKEGPPRGYLVAYPWSADAAPALNVLIDAIPDDVSVIYLHDLAIDPAVRGGGWSRPIVERVAHEARAAGWPALALVAVNDAAAFWERHGFVAIDSPSVAEKLAGYGPDARYMVRALGISPASPPSYS
ncbi:MAG: GNAT family N-acetyltransferase [Brevundimonas sp.]|uniref:GNAT family N-acetyltransferase n=1 Tax=Brevundimonas sp. TaxID=1871086 RepID=UPI0027335547|nr:GNAT family N-acetyltransferase [Brevundimonas sp.]MDZ4108593.1 GNAT family N-acetyltransferase [Brevundimonas sp.]